jgi:hypothetical protein
MIFVVCTSANPRPEQIIKLDTGMPEWLEKHSEKIKPSYLLNFHYFNHHIISKEDSAVWHKRKLTNLPLLLMIRVNPNQIVDEHYFTLGPTVGGQRATYKIYARIKESGNKHFLLYLRDQ